MDKNRFVKNAGEILKEGGKQGVGAALNAIIGAVVTLAVGAIFKKSGGK